MTLPAVRSKKHVTNSLETFEQKILYVYRVPNDTFTLKEISSRVQNEKSRCRRYDFNIVFNIEIGQKA